MLFTRPACDLVVPVSPPTASRGPAEVQNRTGLRHVRPDFEAHQIADNHPIDPGPRELFRSGNSSLTGESGGGGN
jgi:hypothetical protein